MNLKSSFLVFTETLSWLLLWNNIWKSLILSDPSFFCILLITLNEPEVVFSSCWILKGSSHLLAKKYWVLKFLRAAGLEGFGDWRGIASDWEGDLLNEFTAAPAGRGQGQICIPVSWWIEAFLKAGISPNTATMRQYHRDCTGCFSRCCHYPPRWLWWSI